MAVSQASRLYPQLHLCLLSVVWTADAFCWNLSLISLLFISCRYVCKFNTFFPLLSAHLKRRNVLLWHWWNLRAEMDNVVVEMITVSCESRCRAANDPPLWNPSVFCSINYPFISLSQQLINERRYRDRAAQHFTSDFPALAFSTPQQHSAEWQSISGEVSLRLGAIFHNPVELHRSILVCVEECGADLCECVCVREWVCLRREQKLLVAF